MKVMTPKNVTLELPKGGRDSSLEFFRIILMFFIVAHHYVVNSEMVLAMADGRMSLGNRLLMACAGGWGKVGINCFVLMTGYFMCTKNISIRKYLRLYCEVVFYNLMILGAFVISGHEHFTLRSLIAAIVPLRGISAGFVSAFLVFYLMIPFLNILVENMTAQSHLRLVELLVLIFSILPCVPGYHFSINYVEWFVVLFVVASYLRKYPAPWMRKPIVCITCGCLMVGLGMLSLIAMELLRGSGRLGNLGTFYWVADCNKPLALAIAITLFLSFKNLKFRQSACVNVTATTVFGILLIHANCDAMRNWLWKDVFSCVSWAASQYLWAHVLISVTSVFVVCVFIDLIRQLLFRIVGSFVHRPLQIEGRCSGVK